MITELPPVDVLSDRQIRGADCVRCGATLAAGHVVDLGPRPLPGDGCGDWFPRACPGCAAEES